MNQYVGKEKLLESEEVIENDDLNNSQSGEETNGKGTKRDKEKGRKSFRPKADLKKVGVSAQKAGDTKELLENFYHRPSMSGTSPVTGMRKHTEYRAWHPAASDRAKRLEFLSSGSFMSMISLKGSLFSRSPKMEANLSYEISLIVLEVVLEFIKDFKEEMMRSQSVFASRVFGIFNQLLQKNQVQSLKQYS